MRAKLCWTSTNKSGEDCTGSGQQAGIFELPLLTWSDLKEAFLALQSTTVSEYNGAGSGLDISSVTIQQFSLSHELQWLLSILYFAAMTSLNVMQPTLSFILQTSLSTLQSKLQITENKYVRNNTFSDALR